MECQVGESHWNAVRAYGRAVDIPPPHEFVRLVKERLGVEQPSEIARKLGLTDYGAPQRVRRWINGRNGPDYEGTMAMLQAAGWLSMDNGDASLWADPTE